MLSMSYEFARWHLNLIISLNERITTIFEHDLSLCRVKLFVALHIQTRPDDYSFYDIVKYILLNVTPHLDQFLCDTNIQQNKQGYLLQLQLQCQVWMYSIVLLIWVNKNQPLRPFLCCFLFYSLSFLLFLWFSLAHFALQYLSPSLSQDHSTQDSPGWLCPNWWSARGFGCYGNLQGALGIARWWS